jgi:Tol biopolymer transport system component
MYFTADAGDKFHLWRQEFKGGAPEQITSGTEKEEGLAVAADGRSVITSVGEEQSEVWFHDASGDRRIASEGYAANPAVSADGKRMFYVRRQGENYTRVGFASGELWMTELATGANQHLLPGIFVSSFEISGDGKQIVYSVDESGKDSEIWLAPVDGRSPPRRLSSNGALFPHFGEGGDIYFMAVEGKLNYLYRMKNDGTGRQKILDHPILALMDISPDGKWACVWGVLPNEEPSSGFLLYPTAGGPAVKLCNRCSALWSPDGKYLYVSPRLMLEDNGRSFAIPFDHGPPHGGFPADPSSLPGVRTIQHSIVAPGADPSTYAFIKLSVHRNLFRIPLP